MDLIQEQIVKWLQEGLNDYQNELIFKIFLTLGDYNESKREGNDVKKYVNGIADFLPAVLLPIPKVNMFETTANIEFAVNIDTAEIDESGNYIQVKQILSAINGFAREKNAFPFFLTADATQYQVIPLFELADDQIIAMETSDSGEIIPVGFSIRFVVTENIANGNSYELFINNNEINFEQMTITKSRTVNQYSFPEDGNTKGETLQGSLGIDFVMPQFLDEQTDAIISDICGNSNAVINNVKLLIPNKDGEKTTAFYTMKYGNGTATVVRSSNVGINVGLFETNPYTFSIVQDGNVEIECKRISSQNPFCIENEIVKENGALYYQDKIVFTLKSIAGGYSVSSCKVNGADYSFGNEIIVDSDIVLEIATEAMESYTLTITSTGATISCARISSLNSAAPLTELQSGAAIYEGDVLNITGVPDDNYTLDEILVNSQELSSSQITVAGNTVITTETTYYQPFSMSFELTNCSVIVNRVSSSFSRATLGQISTNASVYEGDVLTFNLNADEGKEIDENSVYITNPTSSFPPIQKYAVGTNYTVGAKDITLQGDAGTWVVLQQNTNWGSFDVSDDPGGYTFERQVAGLQAGRKMRFSGYANGGWRTNTSSPFNSWSSETLTNRIFGEVEGDDLVFSFSMLDEYGEIAVEASLTLFPTTKNDYISLNTYATDIEKGHINTLRVTKLEQWQ